MYSFRKASIIVLSIMIHTSTMSCQITYSNQSGQVIDTGVLCFDVVIICQHFVKGLSTVLRMPDVFLDMK